MIRGLIDGPIPIPLTFDEAGVPLTYLPGCRVNIAAWDMQPEWEPHRVEPPHPARVFAGDQAPTFEQTVFLWFQDEDQMRLILGVDEE